jgi:hypothetical protein
MASGMFEVELEAMPAEAAEFEVARRFVNLAASAARHAAQARPRPGVSPQATARAAVAAAARHHAPGVYRIMVRTLGGPAVGRHPAGVAGGVRRPPMQGRPGYRPMPGRPAYRAAPGRPAYRPMPGRPAYRPMPGQPAYGATLSRPAYRSVPGRPAYRAAPVGPGYRAAPARRPASGQPARQYEPRRGPGYVYGYQGAPAGYTYGTGQRRRPGGGAPAPGRRRGYDWGYGGWYDPGYWTEPWTDDGVYVYDGGAPAGVAPAAVPGGGIQASGRWVRRGRQIILQGV